MTTVAPVAGLTAALATRSTWALRHRFPAWGRGWERVNHRGEPLSLVEGPAVVTGLLTGIACSGLPARARLAAGLAVGGAGIFGGIDDLTERGSEKGLRGHLGAAAAGRLTTGSLKIIGVGTTAVCGAGLALSDRPVVTRLAGGAVVAGSANLVNLFDLRPGRALKVAVMAAAWLGRQPTPARPLATAVAGTAAAAAPEDLGELAMMGDAGANALGACLGMAFLLSDPSDRRLAAVLGGLTALTLASERVSFTRIIDSTPGLRELDDWGRRR